MSYIPLEKLLGKADKSIYKLVIIASKRALELAEGQPKLVESTNSSKPSTIALEEIAAGKIQVKK